MRRSDGPTTMCLLIAGIIALGVSPVWADVYLDIQGPGGVTASGYVQLLPGNRWDNGSELSLGGGVEAGWLNYVSAGLRDRGVPDALLRDLLQFGSGVVETLEIRGLGAGAYDLTLHSWDQSWPDKITLFQVDEDNDGVVDHSVTVDTMASQQQATVSVTVAAAGILSITIQGTAGRAGAFNGLDLVASSGPSNQAPTVDAGSDQTITLPTDTINLDGTVSDDGLPDPPAAVTTTWSKVSGPGTVTFGDAAAIDTTARFSTDGEYVLQLEADDGELSATDTVAATVNPESQPTVQFDAGSSSGDESVATVNLAVSLSASYSQTVTVNYTATGGTAISPEDYAISGTQLTFDPGVTNQNIVLTVVDDEDEESAETVEVTLSSPSNATLGANTVHTYTIQDNDAASPGISLYLDIEPPNSSTAAGYQSLTTAHRWDTGTQASLDDGMEAGWLDYYGGGSRDRGSSHPDLTRDFLQVQTSSDPETLKITGLASGAYDLTLYATDPDYVDKRSRFEIDQDNDGAIDVTVEIHTPNGEDIKTVGVMVSSAGVLSIRLDDAGATCVCNGLDLVGTGGPTNQAPTVDAGSDQEITLPTDTVNLDGTVSDDGLPDPPAAVTTTWSKVSGPSTVTFGDTGAVDTTAQFSGAGTYVLQLEADDGALTGSDTTTIIVNSESQPTVQFDATSSAGSEAVTTVNLAVSLSTSYGQTVTVDYAATGGTAVSPDDYSISGTPLTFDPGVISQNVFVTVINDGDQESDETIEVTLSDPVNATLGANTVHTYTIVNNDGGVPPVDVHVDVEPPGASTASGYVSLTYQNRWDSSTEVWLGDGVEAAWINPFDGSSRDRDGSYPDLLTRDFLQVGSSGAPETLEVRGLVIGPYDLTLYATDPAYADKRTSFAIDQDNDGTIDQTVEIHMPNGEEVKTISVNVSSAGVLAITLSGAGATGVFNGFDLVGGTPDSTPPQAVTDLSVAHTGTSRVTLQLTAPADDLGSGASVAVYDVRYSMSPIDEGNWSSAAQAAGEPIPGSPGQIQSTVVTGLSPSTEYYFALKSLDASGNVSGLSNVVSAMTEPPDTVAPAAITDLSVSNVTDSQATLTWTATGDDGTQGQASQYDVRYAASPINDESDFAAATKALDEPLPQAAGSTEAFIVSTLESSTQYWFAVKALDDGAPANASGLSNVVHTTTTEPTGVAYGISNEFSLSPTPSGGPYDPAVPATGPISITNVNVDLGQITRRVDGSGAVCEGHITFDVACSATDIFVWLELSTDTGATWNQRHIHAIGHVGPTNPGTGLSASWLVDGDHGDDCRIRVRVHVDPETYSMFDADNNKFPRPGLWNDYPTLERIASKPDGFDFTSVAASLPHVDFYKKVAALGQVKAGFSQELYPTDNNNWQYYLQCAYFESMDGQDKYVLLQGDVIQIYTSTVHGWRDQIESTFGIPEDHIMVFYTHVHNSLSSQSTFPTTLLQTAIANAEAVEVAFVNQQMGNTYNIHRCVMTDATHAHSSYGNSQYATANNPPLPVHVEYDGGGNIVEAWVGADPVSSIQLKFDGPCDSYLQMILFRSVADQQLKGVVLKWTGHPVNRDYSGDLTQAVRDEFQNRFGSQLELLYGCGFGGNHRQLFAQNYPDEFGSERSAAAFADVLEAEFPTLQFSPLTKIGVAVGYDTFGRGNDLGQWGTDPDRYGVGVQVLCFNDIYLSGLPGEAPSEQGLFIRSRTADTKHVYNAYCNTYYDYYSWGRWFDIGHYEYAGTPPRYESFRMAQEIVRGVNILEQASGQ